MPDRPSEFQALMDRVLTGSEEAARQLVAEYGPSILRAVRRQLHLRLRSKFDSDDFVQDVWASFFADMPQGKSFQRPTDLAAFLARVARNKVTDAVRQRLQRQKYNLNRELSLNDSMAPVQEGLVARQPSPSTMVMSREEWEHLLSRQPLVYRRILARLREGKTPTEIAQEQEISERTVRRVIARVLPGLLP